MVNESSVFTATPRAKALLGFLAVILAGILFAGLNPEGFDFRNDVEWLTDKPGISFGEHGIAYTEPALSAAQFSPDSGLAIEIALRLQSGAPAGFRLIAVVHNGDDSSQLLIGQWRQTLIVMNGDDYDHKRKSPRISVDASSLGAEGFLVTVNSGPAGTSLFVNGVRRGSRKDLMLKVPGNVTPARLVLGGSVYGQLSWSGEILGLAVYTHSLDAGAITAHHTTWKECGSFAEFERQLPLLLYPMTEKRGRIAFDCMAPKIDLRFPRRTTFLERQAFTPGFEISTARRSFARDVILNLLGFVPLGVVLAALLRGRVGGPRSLLLAVAAGATVSFGIEFAQSWMPSRTSSILDLLLNTAGTALGALACILMGRRRRQAA